MAGLTTRDARLAARLERLRYWRAACAVGGEAVARHSPGVDPTSDPAPLVYFHGDWESGGHYVRRLSRQSGIGMVSFAPHGARGDAVPPTIEEMAAERLPVILAAQPHGAFRVAGYCNGALVAYEVARQLLASGREVELVVLIEPPSLNLHPGFRRLAQVAGCCLAPDGTRTGAAGRRIGALMGLAWVTRRGLGLSLRQAMRLLGKKLVRAGPAAVAGATHRDPAILDPEEDGIRRRRDDLTSAYTRAVGAYLPQAIPVRTIILSSGRDESDRRSVWYDCSGWDRLEQRPTIMALPGNHLSCIGEHLGNLAESMKLLVTGTDEATAIASLGDATAARSNPIVAPARWDDAAFVEEKACRKSAGFGGSILAECACATSLTGSIAEDHMGCPHEGDDTNRRACAEGRSDDGRKCAERP